MNCSKVDAKINAIEISKERKIIRAEARASLSSKSFYNANFPHQVKITGAGIKEWLNQPHKHIREKNRELLNLEKLFNESKYLGPTIDKKERIRHHVASFLFLLEHRKHGRNGSFFA